MRCRCSFRTKEVSVQNTLLLIAIFSSFRRNFAILAPSKAGCSSNLATDIVFLGATLVLAIIIFEKRCFSFLTDSRYATAANASSEESQKICTSDFTSSPVSGLIHNYGIFNSFSSSSFSNHLIHHLCSCSSVVSSQ